MQRYCYRDFLMMWCFRKNNPERRFVHTVSAHNNLLAGTSGNGFSLVETTVALIILAMVSSTVLVVINKCIASAADWRLRMQAFEVAGENMEQLLSQKTVEEQVSYGISEKYPAVEFETTVEPFYEPVSNMLWVRAVCTGGYYDSQGQQQQVELRRWLTGINETQLRQIITKRQQQYDSQVIETIEAAVEYAGVDAGTLQQWVDNGMLVTQQGGFVRSELDLFKQYQGQPESEVVRRYRDSHQDSQQTPGSQQQPSDQQQQQQQQPQQQPDSAKSPQKKYHGYTMEELDRMSIKQLMEIFLSGD